MAGTNDEILPRTIPYDRHSRENTKPDQEYQGNHAGKAAQALKMLSTSGRIGVNFVQSSRLRISLGVNVINSKNTASRSGGISSETKRSSSAKPGEQVRTSICGKRGAILLPDRISSRKCAQAPIDRHSNC